MNGETIDRDVCQQEELPDSVGPFYHAEMICKVTVNLSDVYSVPKYMFLKKHIYLFYLSSKYDTVCIQHCFLDVVVFLIFSMHIIYDS